MLGDNVEVGCSSDPEPGQQSSDAETNVYPLVQRARRGRCRRDSIYKKQGDVVAKR